MLASEDYDWTDDRVAQLKALWPEGLSASQIAAELGGGVTRNAVIGKVHRLGLPGRRQGVQPSAPRPPARREPSKPGPITASTFTDQVVEAPPLAPVDRTGAPIRARTRVTDQNRVMDVCDRVEVPASDPPDDVENIIPIGQRCSLLELNDHKCRWPVGDPGAAEFFFCGGSPAEGLPYCVYHSRIAYVSPPSRKRATGMHPDRRTRGIGEMGSRA